MCAYNYVCMYVCGLGLISRWLNGKMDRCGDGWMNGWMNEWTDGWLNGWINGLVDG